MTAAAAARAAEVTLMSRSIETRQVTVMTSKRIGVLIFSHPRYRKRVMITKTKRYRRNEAFTIPATTTTMRDDDALDSFGSDNGRVDNGNNDNDNTLPLEEESISASYSGGGGDTKQSVSDLLVTKKIKSIRSSLSHDYTNTCEKWLWGGNVERRVTSEVNVARVMGFKV